MKKKTEKNITILIIQNLFTITIDPRQIMKKINRSIIEEIKLIRIGTSNSIVFNP